MSIATVKHSAATRRAASDPQSFPPLELVNRPTVPTDQAAHYLLRRPQTLRAWAMKDGSGPLRPLRIQGRLAWPVADLLRLLGAAAEFNGNK